MKTSSNNVRGLDPILCPAHGTIVMLMPNLSVDVGLVNDAMGEIEAILYTSGQCPPELPVAMAMRFDAYKSPTLSGGTVPIIPIRSTWLSSSVVMLPPATPPQACLGCHHPQGPGHGTGQGGDRCGKGIFFRVNVCGLLTHSLPDRSAV